MRLWAFWDQAKLLSEIQRLRKKSLSLYANYVLHNHQKVFSAALRQFGSWRKALLAAGIAIPKYAGGGLAILRALDDAFNAHSSTGIPPSLDHQRIFISGTS